MERDTMKRSWVSLMMRVDRARKRGAGVLMTPQEVEMMYLSFDNWEPPVSVRHPDITVRDQTESEQSGG